MRPSRPALVAASALVAMVLLCSCDPRAWPPGLPDHLGPGTPVAPGRPGPPPGPGSPRPPRPAPEPSPAPTPSPSPAPTPDRIADSLADLVEDQLAHADLSPFERDVLERALATGTIDAADYDEAFARYDRCMVDAGYRHDVTRLPNGLFLRVVERPEDPDPQDLERYWETDDACATGTLKVVESLFTLQQANPDLLTDAFEVAVRCLAAGGLVPVGFDRDDLETLFQEGFDDAPFDARTLEAQSCLMGAGLAVALG